MNIIDIYPRARDIIISHINNPDMVWVCVPGLGYICTTKTATAEQWERAIKRLDALLHRAGEEDA